MKVYAIAMAEVQEDSVLCGSDACLNWDDAVEAAEDFMMRCVGDFYEIDPYFEKDRRAKVEERVFREYSVFKGQRKLECSFRDPGRMFVVTTSVQETEIRDRRTKWNRK